MIWFPQEIAHTMMQAFSIEQGGIWHAAIGFWVPVLWLVSAVLGAVVLAGFAWAAYCVTRGLAAWAIEVIQARKGGE